MDRFDIWRQEFGAIIGEEKLRYDFSDMAVGNGDRSRVRVDLDRREMGLLISTREAAGD